jgi:type I restriction enzyme R subunit
VLDFVNEAGEILEAFRTYYTTATLTDVADPNLVYNLRAKLDAAGHYDDFEVERVVAVELKPGATQGEMVAAIAPVEDRLMKRFRADQDALEAATEQQDGKAAQLARDELSALLLFRGDLAAYLRLYTYLSQIFDYGNIEVEKRAIFYRRLLPLLEFGREREGIDLSKVVLTHHTLKSHGPQPMGLPAQEYPRLTPSTETGTAQVREKERVYLSEIIARVNELFDGELTDQDKLVYVNDVLKGKLLESETLIQQAANNSREQFANSPT